MKIKTNKILILILVLPHPLRPGHLPPRGGSRGGAYLAMAPPVLVIEFNPLGRIKNDCKG